MADSNANEELLAVLLKNGFRVVDPRKNNKLSGFPLLLRHLESGTLAIEVDVPPLIDTMDPEVLGVAWLDVLGNVQRSWGLAKRLRWFRSGESTLLTEIAPLVQNGLEGVHGSLYYDGYRFYVAASDFECANGVMIMVTYAGEEKQAKRQAILHSREAEALKKIGRALNMNQSVVPLAYAAVHEIASVAELAAVLLWTVSPDSGALELVASTGANRSGTMALAKLNAYGGNSCVAELVAGNRQPFFMPKVHGHALTSDLEGRFCYLQPGAISVWPLITGGNLLGVLEIIGRDGDERFEEHLELFQTVAEHLALAIHSAAMFETFEQLASHDPLTGMSNHRALHEFLNLRVAESARTHAEIGVIMIDVDHFRSFNEEEGHDAGDQVLRLVADTIKSIVRPYDLAARYGGEEFTVILPGSGKDSTETIAERMRKKIEAAPFETRTGRQRHVTVSIGCSIFPQTAGDAGSILRAADAALYEAKRSGRNKVVFHEGRFEDRHDGETLSLDTIWTWIPEKQRRKMREKLHRAEPHIQILGKALRLSKNQEQILRALFIVEEPYRNAIFEGNRGLVSRLEKLQEYRILEPSLLALGERFDGEGAQQLAGGRIPLLSRILDALFAFIADGGKSFVSDPGRFDPEIVELVAHLEDAA